MSDLSKETKKIISQTVTNELNKYDGCSELTDVDITEIRQAVRLELQKVTWVNRFICNSLCVAALSTVSASCYQLWVIINNGFMLSTFVPVSILLILASGLLVWAAFSMGK